MRDKLEYTKIAGDVVRITEKAALVTIEETQEDTWIPLSRLFGGGYNLELGDSQELKVQTWFYDRKIA